MDNKCPVCNGKGKVFVANPEYEEGWEECPHCNNGEISEDAELKVNDIAKENIKHLSRWYNIVSKNE